MGRVEDANHHLEQLNRLYLSTIETLAMAIDAKDQITHGHIRRVQQYAIGLARAIGIDDERQIKAIEAAALLHDMGKLAVPEYILNKPGKLTAAEFEKMKLHASVGADILSAIEFPYPVVPIVRHHHENWDGKGYPSGLKMTDIPIGARILSVVDCFDALTSDRPYRPKLSDEEALQILRERRGVMYDPLVVDTFVSVHADIAPKEPEIKTPRQALFEITRSSLPAAPDNPMGSGLHDIASGTEEMLTLYGLARSLAGETALADAGDIIAKHLRRLVPANLCVFYIYDRGADELIAAYGVGDAEGLVRGLRINLGERLSGWVAANRQSIINSDPALDLGELARSTKPRLRSCLSAPLMSNKNLVGVISLYSEVDAAFSEDHRRIVEAVAGQISSAIQRAMDFERVRSQSLKDPITGVPNFEYLRRLLASDGELGIDLPYPLSLLFMNVGGLQTIYDKYGSETGDRAAQLVVASTRRALRGADVLFRYGNDEFVVLLTRTDQFTAEAIRARLLEAINSTPFRLGDSTVLPIRVIIGAATAPIGGQSLIDLVSTAQERYGPVADLGFQDAPPTAIH